MAGPKRWIRDVGVWARDYWVDIGIGLVPLALALTSALFSDEVTSAITGSDSESRNLQWVAIRASAVILCVNVGLVIANVMRSKRLSQLEDAVATAQAELVTAQEQAAEGVQNVFVLSRSFLRTLATGDLKFRNTDRISLYAHDGQSNQFVQLARFSLNPIWDQKSGRSYPASEGCIAKAWQESVYFISDYPAELGDYLDHSEADGVPRDTAAKMRMKSRLYYGRSVRDLSGDRALAVLIIESVDPTRYTQWHLDQLFAGHAGQHLSHLVEMLAPLMPRPSLATEADF